MEDYYEELLKNWESLKPIHPLSTYGENERVSRRRRQEDYDYYKLKLKLWQQCKPKPPIDRAK